MRFRLFLPQLLCFFLFSWGSICNAQINLFIAPNGNDSNNGKSSEESFKSFERVLEEINKYELSSDVLEINVYLKGGKYYLDKPIIINNNSLKNSHHHISFKALNNEVPIITGGKVLKNWINHEGNIYKTNITNSGFRQLYINGVKGVRAREPNLCQYNRLNWDLENSKVTSTGKLNSPIEDFNTTNPVEIVIQKIWACQIFRIKSIENTSRNTLVEFFEEDLSVFYDRPHQIKEDQPFHFENDYSFIDTPYEWYYDTNLQVLYLMIDENEAIEDLSIEMPRLDHLIEIIGQSDSPLKNITFDGITFEHSNWTLPSKEGLYAGQATYIYKYSNHQPSNAAVIVEHGENINFENNIFNNLGGNGIIYNSDVQNSHISGNVFKNIANNAVVIDWDLKPNPLAPCQFINIDNNFITNVGSDYFGAVGIFVGFANNITIEHNYLTNLPYTGISVGWGHTVENVGIYANEIRYNIIDRAMSLMSDGAAIYTLSNQPKTRIHHNIVQNISKSIWGGANFVSGIYLDEGSNNISVYENIFRNVPRKIDINATRIGSNNFLNESIDDHYLTVKNAGPNEMHWEKVITHNQEYSCDFFLEESNEPVVLNIWPYPNPSSGILNISDINLLSAKTVFYEIFDVNGRKVNDKTIINNQSTNLEIDVNRLSKGLYILKLEMDNFVGMGKFFKY